MTATIIQGADFHTRGFGAHSRSVSPSLGVHGTFNGGILGQDLMMGWLYTGGSG